MLIFNICIIIEALTGFFPLGLRSFRQTAGIFFPWMRRQAPSARGFRRGGGSFLRGADVAPRRDLLVSLPVHACYVVVHKTVGHFGLHIEHIRDAVECDLHPAVRVAPDTSENAMRRAIDDHNKISRIITEIGNFRKADNPNITGYEFHVIQLVSQVCPHRLILPYLAETLEELKTREPEPKFPFRARVVLVGSEIDDPEFTKLIETCGAMVVADRYCFGSFPGREQIEIREGETAFDAICRHYLHWNQCARFMDGMKIDQRHSEVKKLADEFKADGVIYENMKFCEFWSYEKILAHHIFTNELGIPTCTIEKEYALGAVGQLRTRFQGFIESLEIKQIQGGK